MNRPAVVIPLVLAVCVFGAVGQAFLKQAINAIPAGSTLVDAAFSVARTGRFYLGIFTVGCGTLLWLYVLSKADLSYAMPFAALGVLVSLATSVFILGEPVAPLRLVGAVVIVVGAALVAKS